MTDIHTDTDTDTDDATGGTGAGGIWPCLAFSDAHAAIDWLERALGFRRTVVYTRDGDESVVEHAELRWSHGGGVMLGTAGKDDGVWGRRRPGGGGTYLVHADPDALHARAVASGAEVVSEPHDTEYGSRDFSVLDPEGNVWNVGTYPGAD